jgi:hypothetical protein
MLRRSLILVAFLFPLAGCDQLGLEAASVTAARVEADGKAVGAACRHGGRAIEDCFTLNRKVDKAAIYAGWREMDDYMRENKIEAVAPSLGAEPKARTADASADDGSDKMDKSAKAIDKPGDKIAKADKAVDKPAIRIDKPEKPPRIDKTAVADADKGAAAH